FSKVDPQVKPGPDPKNPAVVTIDWNVTEQRTGTATIGAGYTGGLNGQGLYGTLSFSNSNLNGTGNGASIQLERGSNTYVGSASLTIPYLGKTPQSQKYSLGVTLFTNGQTNFYPVYSIATNPFATPAPGGSVIPIPVTLFPTLGQQPVGGISATSVAKSAGANVTLGRRLTDYARASFGVAVQRVSTSTTVPVPYFFQSGNPNILVGPTPNPFGNQNNGSFGITAPSIANINTGIPYKLNFVTLGLATDTRDDVFNPHRGGTSSFGTEISAPGIGSDFRYSKSTLDGTRFFPFRNGITIGVHGQLGFSTGALPPNSLFTFSDQQLRGYNSIFYGTDTVLGQIEARKPILAGGKLVLAAFVDEGGYRIRGAQPLLDPFTNRIVGFPGNWSYRGDFGVGIRFDLPQLNLRTIRVDIAHGVNGTHTSFGIGQSF
ncbi:MAG: BamA/TamA family outer membrane protein, partial [Candidatus Eremiobacteraeota bacterium]|nr:BamA/TamA family outer membrane protein [Candidatus Eremiobacteraeota bacterium]